MMMMFMLTKNTFLLAALLSLWTMSTSTTVAFVVPSSSTSTTSCSSPSLSAVKYDKKANRWVTTDAATEGPEAGYGTLGALLRHGPKPALDRILQPDTYDQAVLKFMAQEKCSRQDAEGNMDAFRRNPNDWTEARYQMQKTGYRPDYVTLKTDKLVLTLVWTVCLGLYTNYMFTNIFAKYL
eukprot:scaffold19245_cov199-Amphora_coffeaeformis.AAC.32